VLGLIPVESRLPCSAFSEDRCARPGSPCRSPLPGRKTLRKQKPSGPVKRPCCAAFGAVLKEGAKLPLAAVVSLLPLAG